MNQGLRYKSAREYLGFSQVEVSDSIKLSQNSISKIESNKTDKPNYKYTMFLREKGINDNWLLKGEGEMLSTKEATNKNTKVYKSYKEEENWKLKYEEAELRAEKSEREVSILKETISELRKELNDLYKKIVNNNIHLEVDLGKDKASSSPANLFVSFSTKEVEEKLVA